MTPGQPEIDRAPLIAFFCRPGTITPPQAEEMAAIFLPRHYAKGQHLLQAGEVSDTYLFLQQGFMRSYAIDPEGREITTGFHLAPTLVFEPTSFFRRTPAREHITAMEDCQGWSITFAQLNGLFHSRQEFREFGRGILVGALTGLKERMLSAITEPAEQRYRHLLETRPELLRRATLKHVASYLGITESSLSRIRKELAKK